MIGDIHIYGVFIPWLLVQVLLALLISSVLRKGLSILGVYKWVWHAPLFDLAVFAIILFLTTEVFFYCFA